MPLRFQKFSDAKINVMADEEYFPCCSLEVHKSVENVADSPTLVFHIGRASHSEYCAVVVTGTPGMIEFYEVFMLQLHKASRCHLEVVGISQAGHSPVWNYPKYEASSGYKNANCKNILDQIDHKVAFIDEFVPRDKKIILIGHSIGAYIVLKMLENKELEERVCRSVLLFPTIERITSTPNAKFWLPVSCYFRHPFSLLTWLLSYTPLWIKKMLVDWRTTWKGREIDPDLVSSFLSMLNYTLMNNALIMAASEMQHINELDEKMVATIERNIGKMTFYYAVEDGWAPPHFYVSMKERFPDGDIQLCKNGFEHDFIIDSSAEVAHCVWGMISHLKDD